MEENMEQPNEPEKSGSTFWIIGLVAIIIIVGAVWMASKKKQPSASPASQTAQQQSTSADDKQIQGTMVEYTDSGFSPASITIKAGGTVTFKNSSSSQMQVASAPHPTHTDRPELNAPGPMGSGETFSTVIPEVGTWKYHNHLDPTKFGSITVQ